MGTTSPKNLRYPEPTTEARTLPAQIKNLADDVNSALTYQDTRLNNLDKKNSDTNAEIGVRSKSSARHGASAGLYTHSPNDGVNRTISQHTNMFYIPANARVAQVSMMQRSYGQSLYACAGYWEVLVNFAGTGWQHVNGSSLRVHNEGKYTLDLGFHIVGMFDVRSYRGTYGSVATNFNNDPTSGGYVVHSNLLWSVTSIS